MTNKQEDDLKKEIEDKAIQITYPLAYKKGQEDERKRIEEIWNCWINENSNFYSENYKILNKLIQQIKEKK